MIFLLDIENQKVWIEIEEVRRKAKYVCLCDEEEFGISGTERIYFQIEPVGWGELNVKSNYMEWTAGRRCRFYNGGW